MFAHRAYICTQRVTQALTSEYYLIISSIHIIDRNTKLLLRYKLIVYINGYVIRAVKMANHKRKKDHVVTLDVITLCGCFWHLIEEGIAMIQMIVLTF